MRLEELQKLAQAFPDIQAADFHTRLHEQIRQLGLDPDMLYQELEMSSAYVDTHRDSSISNAHMQLHSHTFYELLYCRNSCGTEYLVGTERYRLQRGDIILVPPGVSHRPLLPEKMTEPYKRYILWLSPAFMSHYAQLFPYSILGKKEHVGLLRTGGTKWESLGGFFRTGVQEAEQKADGWEAAVIGNTLMLLTYIKRATDDRSAYALIAEKPELLDRIMVYVETHYSNPITIGDLATQFFVSSSTVSHLFKQKLGVSFYRYVTQRRLIAGKTLIEKGVSLESVATQIGFQDYSGFYRAFKQEYGISPRQYRNLLGE